LKNEGKYHLAINYLDARINMETTDKKTSPPRNSDKQKDIWSEKRKFKRFQIVIEIGIHTKSNFFTGLTNDISEGGLFVQTYDIQPIGTELEVQILLPGMEEPAKIATMVTWIREPLDMGEDDQAGMGLKLVNPHPILKRAIKKYVRRHEPLFYDV
jgi:uncharacterized protein (TIGR02266 family)